MALGAFLVVVYALISLIFLTRSFAPASITEEDEFLPTVSIVVPTFNEEAIILQKLGDLMKLDYPPSKLELIVVDSSTDGTAELIKAYTARLPVRLIRETERKGEAIALNIGYSNAKGEIVVKSDCDATSRDERALRELVSHFSDPHIGGVSCLYTGSNYDRTESGYRGLLQRLQCGESAFDSTVIAHGAFVGFRQSVLEPVSPDSAADDTELFVKIRKKGYRCVVDERIVFSEIRPHEMSAVLSQRSRRAYGIIRVLFSNLGILFNRKYGRYGLLVFPSNFFMLALSPTLFVLTCAFLAAGLLLEIATWGILMVGGAAALMFLIVKYEMPKSIMAFARAQEAALLGLFLFLSRKPKHVWAKAR